MNFMSVIGIVDHIEINSKDKLLALIYLKVDNVLNKNKLGQSEYQLIPIKFNKQIFKREFDFLKSGSIVGVKGRIECLNSQLDLIAERIKIF